MMLGSAGSEQTRLSDREIILEEFQSLHHNPPMLQTDGQRDDIGYCDNTGVPRSA